MKKWKWIGMAMACAVGMVAFTSCDDDDNDDYARVPDAVTAAFSHQYGNPGYVEWIQSVAVTMWPSSARTAATTRHGTHMPDCGP